MKNTYDQPISIQSGTVQLSGFLSIPLFADALVVLAYVGKEEAINPFMTAVASALNHDGNASLIVDLLSEEENQFVKPDNRDELLRKRLSDVTTSIHRLTLLKSLPIGFFLLGSTATAGMEVSSELHQLIDVAVLVSAKPNNAEKNIHTPTLLIVGEDDVDSQKLNERFLEKMQTATSLKVVAGLTNPLRDVASTEEVIRLSLQWFRMHFNRSKNLVASPF